MREIKFRAWDGERMIEVDVFNIHINKVQNLDNPTWDWYRKDYEVMQFTGLKDTNGTEIYEGDIVKGHWWKRGNAHRHIGRVTYIMAAFKVRGVKQYLGMDDELNPTYEVIGNIYENPELLEVQA